MENEPPVLSWTHPGGDIIGYDILMGPAGNPVQINAAPVVQTTLTDTGHAGDARDYAVIAVDANNEKSLARTLRLPRVAAHLAADSLLRRGVMNKLVYQVENHGDAPVNHLTVIVRINGIDHSSAAFDLAPGQTLDAPVIVPGYSELTDAQTVQTIVRAAADDSERARIVRDSEILVGEGMPVLQLYTEDFNRGGTGKARFTLENTGQADIEILTAQKGGKPSTQIRLLLMDPDVGIMGTSMLSYFTLHNHL